MAESHNGGWGKKDFDDLMDLFDHLLPNPAPAIGTLRKRIGSLIAGMQAEQEENAKLRAELKKLKPGQQG